MILTIPIVYDAQVLRGKRRPPEHVRYWGETTVEIKEVDAANAPVAIRFDTQGWFHAEPAECRRTVELRWHGDALYEPIISIDDEEAHAAHRTADWLKARAHDRTASNPIAINSRSGRKEAIESANDPDVREIVQSNEDHVVKAARQAAARYIVLDGILWEQCKEPALKLAVIGDQTQATIVRAMAWGLASEDIFRLDESDLVKKAIDETNRNYAVRSPPMPLIEIMLSESIRLNLPERRLFETARKFARRTMGARLYEADLDYFTAFQKLRDCMNAFGSALMATEAGYEHQSEIAPRPDGADDLLEALQASVTADERLTGKPDHAIAKELDCLRERLERVAAPAEEIDPLTFGA